MPIEIPVGNDDPIGADSGTGGSGGSGDCGGCGNAGTPVPVGGANNQEIVLPPVIQEIVDALAARQQDTRVDIADEFGFGTEEPGDQPLDDLMDDGEATHDLIRAVKLTQQHEPELLAVVTQTAKSAKKALQLLFADADDDLTEAGAQRLLLHQAPTVATPWQQDAPPMFDCRNEHPDVQDACALLNIAWERAADGLGGDIDVALLTAAFESGTIDPDMLADNIAAVLGFETVIWDTPDEFTHEERATMALNLLTASLHTIAYFDEEVLTAPDNDAVTVTGDVSQTGLELFQQYISGGGQTGDARQGITVHLGADATTGGAGMGLVPLYQDDSNIYLGSQVAMATIVHEFGHQVDRATQYDVSNSLTPLADYDVGILNLPSHIAPVRVASSKDWGKLPEDFADAFMTAVLHGQNVQVSGQTIRWGTGDNATDMRLAMAVHLLVNFDDEIQNACYEIEGPIFDPDKETMCVP